MRNVVHIQVLRPTGDYIWYFLRESHRNTMQPTSAASCSNLQNKQQLFPQNHAFSPRFPKKLALQTAGNVGLIPTAIPTCKPIGMY